MAVRRRRRGYSALGEDSDINLTPLLDIIFNLVFFFIVATTIRTEEAFYELEIPEASEATPAQQTEPIPELAVAADGTLIFKGEPLAGEALVEALRGELPATGRRRAVLSSDAQTRSQDTVRAMDVLKRAGYEDIMWRVRPAQP